MKIFLEISISANEAQRELLIPTMVELGCEGFQETDTALICYIEKSRWHDKNLAHLQSEMKRLLQTISSNAAITFKDIADENWNEQWEKTIQPIEIGKKIVIKPSWTGYENTDGRIVIQIDPKMSFGTGYHETTRLTLQLLEKYITTGCLLLDMGTGTGILAIAGVKLGAKSALGIDNDEWSIDNAVENATANNVTNSVEISGAPLEQFSGKRFDIITANLTLNTNVEFLPAFSSILKPRGILLLSGLLSFDKTTMIENLTKHHFEIVELLAEREWIAIAARKSA